MYQRRIRGRRPLIRLMGPKRLVFATATCAFFAGCYVTEGPSLDDAVRKTKDGGAANDALWPSFGDAGEGFDAGGSFFQNTQPTFGPTTTATDAPPPISGGTLLVTRDGTRAIASDPDRDLVYIVDLTKNQVHAQVALAHGDEPGTPRRGRRGPRPRRASRQRRARHDRRRERRGARAPSGVSFTTRSRLGFVVGRRVGGVRDRRARRVPRGRRQRRHAMGRRARSARRPRVERLARRHFLPSGASAPALGQRRRATRPAPVAVVVDVAARRVALGRRTFGRARDGAPSRDARGRRLRTPAGTATAPGATACRRDRRRRRANSPIMGDASTIASTCPGDADAGCLATSNPIVRGVLTIMRPDGSVSLTRSIPAAVPVDVAVSRDGTAFAVVAAGNALTQRSRDGSHVRRGVRQPPRDAATARRHVDRADGRRVRRAERRRRADTRARGALDLRSDERRTADLDRRSRTFRARTRASTSSTRRPARSWRARRVTPKAATTVTCGCSTALRAARRRSAGRSRARRRTTGPATR